MYEAGRYYTNIVGKYGAQVQMLLKKAAALDIKTIYVNKYKDNPLCVRVLCVGTNGKKVLSKINKFSEIQIVTSVANFLKKCNTAKKEFLEKDITATNIYMLGYEIPEHRKFNLDYTKKIN